ncbi:hypothetical protein ACHAXM_004049 [Skeletonema potamos]|jgi:hypothetical protein
MKQISLSLEYQQAKRNYKASKSSQSNALNKENEAANRGAKIRNSKNQPSLAKAMAKTAKLEEQSTIPFSASNISSSVTNGAPSGGVARLHRRSSAAAAADALSSPNDVPPPQPTIEKGLELLGLIRPSDCGAEFGLSKAIQTHLIESIKLCGLKSRRETSLIDMVTTLCNHLNNRENAITMWTQFADTVATAAASKLQDSIGKMNDARESATACQIALQSVRSQYASTREEQVIIKQDVKELLSAFPALIAETKLKLGSHIEYLNSESKTEVCDAVEELARVHDNEKQKLETTIHSLSQAVHSAQNKMKVLQNQIEIYQNDLDAEKKRYSELEDELSGAKGRLHHLEKCMENERIDKEKEISDMEERMNKELDDIEKRVKESFAALVGRKDREIAIALRRAENAEKVLEELKASLGPMIATSKQTSER